MKMVANKSKLIITTVASAVMLTSGLAAYAYANNINGINPLYSAQVIPDKALMAGMISTEPKTWRQLQQFGTPEAQKIIAKNINFNIGILSYVKPWLGNAVFAVLPSQSSNPASAPNFLVVVATKDKFSGWVFANIFKAQRNGQTQDFNYKGTTISETTSKRGTIYTALLDNRLVVSDTSQTVELAIDTLAGKPSFLNNEGAAKFFDKGIDINNPVAELYVPNYKNAVQQLLEKSIKIPPKLYVGIKSLSVGVGVDKVGVNIKAIATTKPNFTYSYKTTPGKVIAQLPTQTIALVSGQGISSLWSALLKESNTNLQTLSAIFTARQRTKLLNLDLDKDILSWMDGEFALAVIPYNQGAKAPEGFAGALICQTSNRPTAQATLNKLDAIAKRYAISLAQKSVAGKAVTEWEIAQQKALLGYGWLDAKSVFVAVGDPLVDTMLANKVSSSGSITQPLEDSEIFKDVIDTLPKPNIGYIYVNMDKTMPLISPYLPQSQANSMSSVFTVALNSIRAMGMTAVSSNPSTSQFNVSLALKSKNAK